MLFQFGTQENTILVQIDFAAAVMSVYICKFRLAKDIPKPTAV